MGRQRQREAVRRCQRASGKLSRGVSASGQPRGAAARQWEAARDASANGKPFDEKPRRITNEGGESPDH